MQDLRFSLNEVNEPLSLLRQNLTPLHPIILRMYLRRF